MSKKIEVKLTEQNKMMIAFLRLKHKEMLIREKNIKKACIK